MHELNKNSAILLDVSTKLIALLNIDFSHLSNFSHCLRENKSKHDKLAVTLSVTRIMYFRIHDFKITVIFTFTVQVN